MNRCFFLFLLLLSCSVSFAQTKRALVIGIGKYAPGTGWHSINGDRDADSVVRMLALTGFKDVVCLKNEKATKANIVRAFNALAGRCRLGDVVYIHFSGHGQQVKDANGDEVDDALDESWIPYDACVSLCAKDRGEKHLVDDEIGALLDNVYAKVGDEGRILVVADACHSASSTRYDSSEGLVTRGSDKVFQTKVRNDISHHPQNWILLSACADKQCNVELKNPAMGMLTFAIISLVRNGRTDDNKDFVVKIQRFFDRHRSSLGEQTVSISGDKSLFKISQLFVK